jgi:hypothetical protein
MPEDQLLDELPLEVDFDDLDEDVKALIMQVFKSDAHDA